MNDSVLVNLFHLVKCQSLSQPWAHTFPAHSANKTNLASTISSGHKALMTFCHDYSNIRVPAFLEFLVNALSTTSPGEFSKHTCKCHAASLENSHYFLLSNTLFVY